MPESFDRYRRFSRRETNPLIDAHVIFFQGYTKAEVLSGILSFAAGMYVLTIWLIPGLLLLVASGILPSLLKTIRALPRNIFAHSLWYLGLWSTGLPERLKRPKKTYLTL